MEVAAFGQLNFEEPPPLGGSRNVDCFEKMELIGEGTFGQVYRAKEIKTGEIVALKKIRIDNERGFPIPAIREITILKMLHHENIIRLKEVVTSSGRNEDNQEKPDKNRYKGDYYMVLEYMDHDLDGLAYDLKVKFTVPQIKCYMKQLLTGLQFCHDNRVLHRDIKSANILVNNKGILKLADFGLARWIPSNPVPKLTNEVITLWYRPPELLLGAMRYGTPIDIWSVGCVFAELLKGKPILRGKTESDQLNKICKLCGTPDEKNWPGVSKMHWYSQMKSSPPLKRRVREIYRHFDCDALELLDKMLVLDPTKRICTNKALAAAYFSTKPLPSDPKSLPTYESSRDFKIKQKREETAATNVELNIPTLLKTQL